MLYKKMKTDESSSSENAIEMMRKMIRKEESFLNVKRANLDD